MSDPRSVVQAFERQPSLPSGEGERFAGFAVMAAPFRSGHLLALRRFPASSLGRGYTSIWHRAPDGAWTFWADAPALRSCARYFGSALDSAEERAIDLQWTGAASFEVRVPSERFEWRLQLGTSPEVRAVNKLAALVPDALWRSETALGVMSRVAGFLLQAGRLQLTGQTPNGQHFLANPMQMWTVDSYTARLGDEDFGPPGPLPEQAHLGDLWIPQRALFTVARSFLETTDFQRHHVRTQSSAALLTPT